MKKLLIAILNLKPNGVLADEINREFSRDAGCDIPFSRFGYSSLLTFLEYELKDNIRIDNGNGWNIKLYPIATERSGHMLKMKAEEIQNTQKNIQRR